MEICYLQKDDRKLKFTKNNYKQNTIIKKKITKDKSLQTHFNFNKNVQ